MEELSCGADATGRHILTEMPKEYRVFKLSRQESDSPDHQRHKPAEVLQHGPEPDAIGTRLHPLYGWEEEEAAGDGEVAVAPEVFEEAEDDVAADGVPD